MSRFVHNRKDLNDEERLNLFMLLVKDFNGTKLLHGSIKRNAELFRVSCKTVSRIWELGSKFIANGDISKKLSKRVGPKPIHIDIEKLNEIPLRCRKTITALAHALGMSKSTVNRGSKKVQSSIDGRTYLEFMEMFDHVIIDEKWFYLSKETEKYYLGVDELDPYHCYKSKKFITVLFLAVVARPRFDESGGVLFYGKIGIFPFCYQEPVKWKSKNRPAGTMKTKPILVVTQEVSRTWMIEKVIPVIRDRWPTFSRGSTIYIQQDNACPHIKTFDERLLEVAKTDDGFDIRLICQPPNNPELNVLDLGYFRAIQSLQYQESPRNIDELVGGVEKSYNQLSPKALNSVFITLQECMIGVIKSGGSNNFKIPHMRKEKLEREGMLPLSLTVDNEVLQVANDYSFTLRLIPKYSGKH